ncbi:MAG TPA: hypothetical protein VL983_00430 [Terriglobales bacterium]|nr:hypothetical protein [Terriglobales bacterium]
MDTKLGLALGACVLTACAGGFAQENMAEHMPPKVLAVTREFTKPGKNGMSHEKTESVFVKAMTKAKWPTHYLAVESLSGKPRVLFLTGYDSFEAWEKDMKAEEKNEALSAELDRANVADGELLSGMDQSAEIFRKDLSLRPEVDIAHMRYFEISRVQVKQGHDKDWEALVKMYQSGFEKIPEAHWVVYQSQYGHEDGTYIIFTPMKSAAEIDSEFGEWPKFTAAMGDDGMKKLNELTAATVESSETNLFAFNPKMSYVGEDWIKADPDFWKSKPAAEAKPAAKKPAAQ